MCVGVTSATGISYKAAASKRNGRCAAEQDRIGGVAYLSRDPTTKKNCSSERAQVRATSTERMENWPQAGTPFGRPRPPPHRKLAFSRGDLSASPRTSKAVVSSRRRRTRRGNGPREERDSPCRGRESTRIIVEASVKMWRCSHGRLRAPRARGQTTQASC